MIVAKGGMSRKSSASARGARRRVFMRSYGCQMNLYDSERMIEILEPLGFSETESPEEADLIIFNTCHIRAKATEKLYSDLGRIRAQRREGSKLAVAGCVAQAEGAELLRRAAPNVDFIVGPQSSHRLPELLSRGEDAPAPAPALALDARQKFRALPHERKGDAVSRFLSVQEGCDRFCSFCVVPYARGEEVSRGAASLLKEARSLAGAGAREITLLGQNVNAYRGRAPEGDTESAWGLGRLIRAIARIPEIRRVGYTTSHPKDMNPELIRAHAEEPKLMPFLHLPAQSGSDKILKAMNRRHDRAFYLDMVRSVREARPDIALSSDFIVGFPGETEEDFQETLALVREARFAQAYSFKYSPRPGTPAATMGGEVPEAVKMERLHRLRALLDEEQYAFNKAFEGRSLPVLIMGRGGREGQMKGRSPYGQTVYMEDGDAARGAILEARIERAGSRVLQGAALS